MIRAKDCVKTQIQIEGMCCDKCAKRCENALSVVEGVVSADVKFKKSQATLRSRVEIDEGKICEAVESVGFKVLSIEKI